MQILKQYTPFSGCLGPILDTNGAAYSGAIIGDINIWKNGITSVLAAPSTLEHIHNGSYLYIGWSGDTDILGRIDISCNKDTYAMSQKTYEVLPENTYEAIVNNPAGSISGIVLSDYNGGVRLSPIGAADAGSGVWTANPSAYSGVNQFGRELQPIYYADIKQYYDFDNSRDEYGVDWYRGNEILGSGTVTNAAISVYDTTNGTAVFQNSVLNPVSTVIGTLRYQTASILTGGEPYNAIVSGTIDGANRVWQRVIGRNKLS